LRARCISSRLHFLCFSADRTEAVGQRLKEGSQINQSLSALGLVIKCLVDKAKHIPYRDSKLTRLLCNSLGGNSLTLIIANVSPAQASASESVSTLRFANRAKNIKNKPVINVDPKALRIRKLEAELAALRKQLSDACKKLGLPVDLSKLTTEDVSKSLASACPKENRCLTSRCILCYLLVVAIIMGVTAFYTHTKFCRVRECDSCPPCSCEAPSWWGMIQRVFFGQAYQIAN